MISNSAGLVEHSTIEALVQAYRDAEAEITEGYRLLEVAQQRLTQSFTLDGFGSFSTNPRGDCYVGAQGAECAMQAIKRRALRAIVERLAIRPILSRKRWRELDDQIERAPLSELPEITEEGIAGIVEGIARNLDSYFLEMVDEVFEVLRPRRHWRREYKTNTEFEIGRKVVLFGTVERSFGFRNTWRPSYRAQDDLNSLDNVMLYLDGKTRPPGSYYGPLAEAIMASEGNGETDYFKFRCFHNGNLHLTFKRRDLIAEFNRIAGGRRVKPREGFDEESPLPTCL